MTTSFHVVFRFDVVEARILYGYLLEDEDSREDGNPYRRDPLFFRSLHEKSLRGYTDRTMVMHLSRKEWSLLKQACEWGMRPRSIATGGVREMLKNILVRLQEAEFSLMVAESL